MDKKKGRAPIACLYAAPGFFGRRNEKKDEGGEADIKEVYAAPAFFDGREEEEPEDTGANGEYPANYEEKPQAPLAPDPAVMMCVYAGPDFFAGKTDIHGNPINREGERPAGCAVPQKPEAPEEEGPMLQGKHPIPDEKFIPETPLMGLVMHDPGKNGVMGMMGMTGGMNAEPPKKPFVERVNGKQPNFCRECGGKLTPEAKFCPNCGAKVYKC